METGQGLLRRLSQFTARASLLSVVAFGLPGIAAAADVTVDCDGPGPADFGSISDALAALSLEGPNTIFVLPGSCVENVVIHNRERLTIVAPDGNVHINPADPDQPVITIGDSRGIVLVALAAYNSNQNGVAITSSSQVQLFMHSIDNDAAGYFVESSFSVYFASHATGNGSDGLFVWEGSEVLLESATMTGNGGFGAICRDGSTCVLKGNVVVENNSSVGLVAVNNSLIKVSSLSGPNTVQGNAFYGIYLARNSVADLRGDYDNLVTANNGPGIHLESNSSLGLFNSTISNNTGPGVEVLRSSAAEIVGTNTITNNGVANLACDSTALIHGNLSGISRVNCGRIERVVGPPRPGRIF